MKIPSKQREVAKNYISEKLKRCFIILFFIIIIFFKEDEMIS